MRETLSKSRATPHVSQVFLHRSEDLFDLSDENLAGQLGQRPAPRAATPEAAE